MAIKHYQEPTTRQAVNTFPLTYLITMLVLAYCVFLVVQSMWHGVKQSQVLAQNRATLDQLTLQKEVAQRFVVYQQTPSYIEKQARLDFGYAWPSETIVILPQNTDVSSAVADEQAAAAAQASEKVISPHLHQWLDYFFK